MKLLLIVPLLGVVMAAPLAEERNIKVKRAMETIMYGNQQNSNKQVKKSDPSVPLHDDIPDVKAEILPDDGGSVEASKAEDIIELKSDETPEDELNTVVKAEELDENEENAASDSLADDTSSQTEDESNIPQADAEAIEELKNSIGEDSQGEDSSENQPITNVASSDEQNYDNYDLYKLYREYQNMIRNYRPLYDVNNYRKRRMAIRKRRFMGRSKERAVKRAHRSKRDLTYPEESELYEPYYYPELSYPNTENYGYGSPYETEDQMEPLEELLEENVLPYPVNSYDEPSWYDYRPTNYDGDEGMYLPVKRQSMLSFVPGNRKRSSPYFYPVSEEPETHFGAFVPEKRNYFNTYGSLVRAARLLAARQEERDPLQGYEEWY
ncbi:uncharacterized protein LOC127725459 [Mytilus californianus]|uniref:uncharacterized protein LOC127725459 n=1 Tax=Mytilus californianus TaxID=6549 RepID=UPI0022465CC5|nr:uncharacterized protein LOC127725459 [Mytilus californianus]